jgi:hypothetical protein
MGGSPDHIILRSLDRSVSRRPRVSIVFYLVKTTASFEVDVPEPQLLPQVLVLRRQF